MASAPKTDLDVFLETAERIRQLTAADSYGLLASARALPASRANAYAGVQISSGSHYGDKDADARTKAAKEIQKALTERERAAGAAERDRRLLSYADEIERLRAVLPGLAAKAAIEAGVIARALRTEATNG